MGATNKYIITKMNNDTEPMSIDKSPTESSQPTKEPVIKFRNYYPIDPKLRELKIPEAQTPALVEEITLKLKQLTTQGQDDLLNLAPKKPTWDLKRDLQNKLDVIENRTQRAIVEILREKVEKSEKEDVVIEG